MRVDYGAAGTVLEFGVKQFPHSVKLHVALGLALYAQDCTQEGAEALCQAADLDPLDEHPMEVLADTETIPRDLLPTAVEHLSTLHQLYPANGEILFDLTMARSGLWSGEPAAATPAFLAHLHQAITLSPNLPKAYLALATAHEQNGSTRDAIAALQQAVALAPELAQTHYRLAFAYRRAGDEQHFHEQIKQYEALRARHVLIR